jgi:hypothetical protein
MRTIMKIIICVLCFVVGTFIGRTAFAQQMCSSRIDVVEHLYTNYKEHSIGMGLTHNGTVTELLVSPTQTWTIIITKTNGISCIVATGEAWTVMQVKEAINGSKL